MYHSKDFPSTQDKQELSKDIGACFLHVLGACHRFISKNVLILGRMTVYKKITVPQPLSRSQAWLRVVFLTIKHFLNPVAQPDSDSEFILAKVEVPDPGVGMIIQQNR